MRGAAFFAAMLAACAASASAEPYHFIPGRVPLDWQGPDGNTVILDTPKGLIVIDTGRSPMHAQAILDYAKERRRPIAAIVNSHWHLDHTTGNYDIRAPKSTLRRRSTVRFLDSSTRAAPKATRCSPIQRRPKD